MSTVPRVAIVGCGRMGKERAKWLLAAGARVMFCVDADTERARALSAQCDGSRPRTSIDEIDRDQIDAVFICTPPDLRATLVRAASDAGVAVFAEKPLAIDAPTAQALLSDVERSGIITAVGYMNRYRPGIIRARERVLEHGGLVGIAAYWACRRYGVSWWSNPRVSGGPFNEQATHMIDLLRYLGGDVTEARALSNRSQETVGVSVRLGRDAIGTLLYTCEAADKWIGMHVITTDGVIPFEGWNFKPATPADPEPDPFALEVEAFLQAVRERDSAFIRCDFREAFQTQIAVDAIRAAFVCENELALR